MKKLLIVHWFGPFPEWYPLWVKNISRLREHGYSVLLETNLDGVRQRVKDKLGVEFPGVVGGTKMHDLRPALGVLYEEEIEGYDFYGHTDLDVIYGRIDEWLPDSLLDNLDLHSNHGTYVCGPWSLYRNTAHVRELFRSVEDWREQIEAEATTGWVETIFSQVVDAAFSRGDLRRLYSFWQVDHAGQYERVHWNGDRLMDGEREIFMCHFNRTKIYPEGCR